MQGLQIFADKVDAFAGMKIFGFMGLIFGPLLISYFIILVKIYINEFAAMPIAAEQPFKD